jgi:hypothetical protein
MPTARLVNPVRISAGQPELRGVATANFDSESEPLLNREGAIVYKKQGGLADAQHFLSPCYGVKIVFNYGHWGHFAELQ